MNKFRSVLIVLISLLGISAGIPKMLLMPQEVELFNIISTDSLLIRIFGLIQLTGAILILPSKMRKAGCVLLLLTFGFSTALIFIKGEILFGFISLIPLLFVSLCLNAVGSIRQLWGKSLTK